MRPDFQNPYPIYDMTKSSIPCLCHADMVALEAFAYGLIGNHEKVTSKNNIRPEYKNYAIFKTKTEPI